MRKVAIFSLLAGFIGLAVANRAEADLYMYKDGRGALHFSNAPANPKYKRFNPPGLSRGGRLSYSSFPSKYSSYRTRPDPARRKAYDTMIRDAARRYRVDHALVKAVIRAESDFVPYAKSPAGAQGLMQLMPATARQYNARAYEPRDNIEAGTKHLRGLLDMYDGNVRLALAAYNAGSEAVSKHRGVPPYRETVDYLDRVLRFHAQYSRDF
jgi:soluble lytic murein transglycosylase-like protein